MNWRAAALEISTRPREWQEAGPGNGWHAGNAHIEPVHLLRREMTVKDGEADYSISIDAEGAIHARYWIHIQKGKDNPTGIASPVRLFAGMRSSEWSWITPEEAKKSTLIAMAYEAERFVIEALADGGPDSQKAAYAIRAWAEMEIGRSLPWAHSRAEIEQAAAERRAWLAERRAVNQRSTEAQKKLAAIVEDDDDGYSEETDTNQPQMALF